MLAEITERILEVNAATGCPRRTGEIYGKDNRFGVAKEYPSNARWCVMQCTGAINSVHNNEQAVIPARSGDGFNEGTPYPDCADCPVRTGDVYIVETGKPLPYSVDATIGIIS